MGLEWWHWAVAGMILIVMELGVGSFVLIWFGMGALVLALLTALVPGMGQTTQTVIWVLVSLGMVVLWFRIFKPGLHKTRLGMSDANVVGEVGLLVRAVSPFERGSVRFQKPILGSDTWDCFADDTIEGGERVRVVEVEGSLLKVGKA